jgi:hypothetical protein
MVNEQVEPQTKGVAVELLARLTSVPRSQGWRGTSFACEW